MSWLCILDSTQAHCPSSTSIRKPNHTTETNLLPPPLLALLLLLLVVYATLQLTDPFLQLFRGIIPPIGGIDLSVRHRQTYRQT